MHESSEQRHLVNRTYDEILHRGQPAWSER
jgi:hypothetical protein